VAIWPQPTIARPKGGDVQPLLVLAESDIAVVAETTGQ
jgi:hypothetical protein